MEGGVSKFNILTHRWGGFRLDGEGCQYTESVAELAAGATVTTFTARASAVVTTGTAVATFTAGCTTLATRATGTFGRFYIAFGLRLERTERQTVFTGFLVYLYELDGEFVTLLDA